LQLTVSLHKDKLFMEMRRIEEENGDKTWNAEEVKVFV
jgi:hypothetical protein